MTRQVEQGRPANPRQISGQVPGATLGETGRTPTSRHGRSPLAPRRPGIDAAGPLPEKENPVDQLQRRRRGGFKVSNQRRKLEDLVVAGRKEGLTFAASNLEHYLGGSGVKRKFNPDWLRQNLPIVRQTERRVEGHFENWLAGRLIPEKQQEKIDFDAVRNLKEGDRPITTESEWEGRIVLGAAASGLNRLGNQLAPGLFPIDRAKDDQTFGSGKSEVVGNGTIEISRVGGVLRFRGAVAMSWKDLYNFDDEIAGLYNPDTSETTDTSRQAMRLFEERGGAAPFLMSSTWTRKVEGTLTEAATGLVLENVRWADSPRLGRPDGDPSR